MTRWLGAKPCFFRSLRISFLAARLSVRDWTRQSRTSPSASIARHRYIHFPLIETNILSRCHCPCGRGRRERRCRAIAGQKPGYPLADRFVADLDAAFCQQILNIAEAQGEAKIQPHRALDDIGRKPVAAVVDFAHAAACAAPPAPTSA